jgi:hypothetical protein
VYFTSYVRLFGCYGAELEKGGWPDKPHRPHGMREKQIFKKTTRLKAARRGPPFFVSARFIWPELKLKLIERLENLPHCVPSRRGTIW